MSGKGALSFDFSSVTVDSGLGLRDVPVGTPLYATVDSVTTENFRGEDKFVLQHTIFVDPDDDSKTVQFKTFIGRNMGWLLAQYLNAVGEDFRSLSGQPLTADALKTVLVGPGLMVTVRESKYNDASGNEKTSKQINKVDPVAIPAE